MLLEKKGFRIAFLKLDPYLNVDPGTMNPYQHGEVYVTEDGAETDLDLGHYFRFTDAPISALSNVTSGQIYHAVIQKERKGDYMGQTVQVIPHITEEIKARIDAVTEQDPKPDIVLVEIGGTSGDIESLPFLEAIRQYRHARRQDCVNIHLTYVPFLKAAKEWKTKPSQHSVQILREIGIIPDMILCRCESSLPNEVKQKIALYCDVDESNVIDEPDVAHSIYSVPLSLHAQQLDHRICEWLHLPNVAPDLDRWKQQVAILSHPKKTLSIGIVGKYLEHQDAYKSIYEALTHGAIAHGCTAEFVPIESDKLSPDSKIETILGSCDGYLIPGGFGRRGWEGKIRAIQYCREKGIPLLGICMGMQAMVVEFARNVAHLDKANSTEVDPDTPHPVISLLSEQKNIKELGGTMRLGAYSCTLRSGTKAHQAYGKDTIFERHRHRWEFNNAYLETLESKGLIPSGIHEKGPLCEVVEIKGHPWMVGVQFHPEFISKPIDPHPLFQAFAKAMLER